MFYVIEADANTLSVATKRKLLNGARNGDTSELAPVEFGNPRGEGHWASCISVVDPIGKEVTQRIELEENEAAFSIAAVSFSSQDDEWFLVVGTGKDTCLSPRKSTNGYIHIYRFLNDGKELEFIHKTKVDEPPLALLGFQGRLLAGIGKDLKIYDLGMKQLLRKAQGQVAPNLINGLQTQGSRVIVSDVQESVTYVVYKYQDNRLIPFADDMIPRFTTCTTMVDYETVAGGDRFGNFWIVRCPQKASDESDEDPAGGHLIHERSYLQGAPNRLNLMCHFYPQDIPTSVQKAQLVTGGRDTLVWTGLQGTIGLMIPFVSREDVDFFQTLEQHMRTEDAPIAGRDHLIYRSYYVPVKGVIDGDLCENYSLLPRDKKAMIAAELDRSIREVERKIAVSFPRPPFVSASERVLTYSAGYAESGCVLAVEQLMLRQKKMGDWRTPMCGDGVYSKNKKIKWGGGGGTKSSNLSACRVLLLVLNTIGFFIIITLACLRGSHAYRSTALVDTDHPMI